MYSLNLGVKGLIDFNMTFLTVAVVRIDIRTNTQLGFAIAEGQQDRNFMYFPLKPAAYAFTQQKKNSNYYVIRTTKNLKKTQIAQIP